MLDTTIKTGFWGKKVRESLDTTLVDIYGIIRTGHFHYIDTVRFVHKEDGNTIIGIYEDEIDGKKYVWGSLAGTPLKRLFLKDQLSLIL